MIRFSIALLLTLALQQKCSFTNFILANREQIRTQAEQGLRPYFPHVHAMVTGDMLIALTCADLGLAAIRDLPPVLDKNPQLQQLRQFGGFAGIARFGLGFPDTILVLNLQSKQYQLVSASSFGNYDEQYTDWCLRTAQ